ncbi:MAG: lipid-A-disaccharide synthase N-terminal domain-containing protein [Pirellulaceae bacterium]|nr:lipid-A-disaccharide synthase N-terminal domain-containing protein [Planctomycetales bacterium]
MDTVWLTIGLGGQLLFTARFLVQWLSSERAGRSVIPLGFWYLSVLGGLTLLIYACHRADPVFILGQSTGLVIYLRNLILIRREQQTTTPVSSVAS